MFYFPVAEPSIAAGRRIEDLLGHAILLPNGPLAVPEGSGLSLVYSHIEELLVPAPTITVGVFVLVQST